MCNIRFEVQHAAMARDASLPGAVVTLPAEEGPGRILLIQGLSPSLKRLRSGVFTNAPNESANDCNLARAEQMYLDRLRTEKSQVDPSPKLMAKTLFALTSVYLRWGESKTGQAIATLTERVTYAKLVGHDAYISALGDVVALHEEQGHFEEAAELDAVILETVKSELGDHSPEFLRTQSSILARSLNEELHAHTVNTDNNHLAKKRAYLKLIYDRQIASLGVSHADSLATLHHLATLNPNAQEAESQYLVSFGH
jgi:hypothetical protein